MKYLISRGLLRPPLEVELDPPPPCLYCGTPVVHPSMNGPLVCGPCDCGCEPDGTRWTSDQARSRHAHFRAKVAEYRKNVTLKPEVP